MRPRLIRWVGLFAACLCTLIAAGCNKDNWLHGDWLLITEDGKPSYCHRFGDRRALTVFPTSECRGVPDSLLSGKWQLVSDERLAIQRGDQGTAQLSVITARAADHFDLRGAVAGRFFRISTANIDELIKKLTAEHVIKVHALPLAWGCEALNKPVEQLMKTEKDTHPRLVRTGDVALNFRLDSKPSNADLSKITFAINQDQLEWVALVLGENAFRPPGPQGKLEQMLGGPSDRVTVSTPDGDQHIWMWKSYCHSLRGTLNQDIDVTLFVFPQPKTAAIYVSTGAIAETWEQFKQVGK